MAFRSLNLCSRLLATPSRSHSPLHAPGSSARRLSTSSVAYADQKVAPKKKEATEWQRAVSEAERIVGYNSSFMNLRYIFNDEMAGVALQLRKILGSNHPLIRTAKSLMYNEKTPMQSWGLLILLVSKAYGFHESLPEKEREESDGILHSQRTVAEIIEIIRVSFLVHQSLINLQPLIAVGHDMSERGDDLFGNKIGLLTGDYLISVASNQLSSLRDQYVVENITCSVRDMAEGEFVGDRDDQNQPLPSPPKPSNTAEAEIEDEFDFNTVFQKLDVKGALGHPEREWTVRNLLTTASLLGRGCYANQILAKQPKEQQRQAYLLGKHLGLAWQASVDLEPFTVDTMPEGATFNLVSAPVLYHLNANPGVYSQLEKGKRDVHEVDFVQLHRDVLNGPGIERTKQLQRKHIIGALKHIDDLPNAEARAALQNMTLAMQDL